MSLEYFRIAALHLAGYLWYSFLFGRCVDEHHLSAIGKTMYKDISVF